MMKSLIWTVAVAGAVSTPAMAQNYTEFPAPIPYQRAQHSVLTGRYVCIPPYPRPFPIRVYTTPPQPPFYNVPPYAVVAPY